MVGDDLKLDVVGLVSAVVLVSTEGFGLLDQRQEEVGFKVGRGVFKDGNDPFQPHPRINVLVGQRFVGVFGRVVELGEDDVPDFQVAFVFPARVGFRIIFWQVVHFLTAVVEDFRVRPRWSLADVPEVVLVGQEVVFFDPDLQPILLGFQILRVVGDVEAVRIKAKPFVAGQEFPGPRNYFVLEVVADREVPQHFKHRVVAGRLTDVFNVVGPDTLLRRGHPRVVWYDLPVEVLLHRCHPGVDPKQSRVIDRHEGSTWHLLVAVLDEEIQKHPPHLGTVKLL